MDGPNAVMNATTSSGRSDNGLVALNDSDNQVARTDPLQAITQQLGAQRDAQNVQTHQHNQQPPGSGTETQAQMHPAQLHASCPSTIHLVPLPQPLTQEKPSSSTAENSTPNLGTLRHLPQHFQTEPSTLAGQVQYNNPIPHSGFPPHPRLLQHFSEEKKEIITQQREHSRPGSVSDSSVSTPTSTTFTTTSIQSTAPQPAPLHVHSQSNSHPAALSQPGHAPQSHAVFATPPVVPSSFRPTAAHDFADRPSLVSTNTGGVRPVPGPSHIANAATASLRRASGSTFPTMNENRGIPLHAQTTEFARSSSQIHIQNSREQQRVQVNPPQDQGRERQHSAPSGPRQDLCPSVKWGAARLMKIIGEQRADAARLALALHEKTLRTRESEISRRLQEQTKQLQSQEKKIREQINYMQQQAQHLLQRDQEIKRLWCAVDEARQEAGRANQREQHAVGELARIGGDLQRIRQERNMLRKAMGIGASGVSMGHVVGAGGSRPVATTGVVTDVRAMSKYKPQNQIIIDLGPDPETAAPSPTRVPDNNQAQHRAPDGNCPPQANNPPHAPGQMDPNTIRLAQENESLRAQLARVRDVLQLGESMRGVTKNGQEVTGAGMNELAPSNAGPPLPEGLPDLEAMQRAVDAARAVDGARNRSDSRTNGGYDGSSLLTPPSSEIFPHPQPAVTNSNVTQAADVAARERAETVGTGSVDNASLVAQTPVGMASVHSSAQKPNAPPTIHMPYSFSQRETAMMVPQKRRASSPNRESDERDTTRSRLRG